MDVASLGDPMVEKKFGFCCVDTVCREVFKNRYVVVVISIFANYADNVMTETERLASRIMCRVFVGE